MKVIAPSTLSFVFSLLFAGQVFANEFKPIFDGESLAGWRAPNMSYWSVRDGAITAESTEANPCTANQFLVWQDGEVADFELKLKFRLAGNRGNSGIQFRSRISPEGRGVGYQADILPSGGWLGALCDENTGRKTLVAPNGHKTVIDADGKRTTSRLGDPVKLKKAGEWNDYHIIARGKHIILRVNGQKSAEVIDNETGHFDLKGILALQLRSGPPMKVQFKDILLKRLRSAAAPGLRVGWATTDITPDKPVPLVGFGTRRFSQGVKDPLTATVLALESVGTNAEVTEQAIMISCDLISIRKSTQEFVRRLLKQRLPNFNSDKVLLNATHTHQAPQQQSGTAKGLYALTPEEKANGWMSGDDYGKLLAERVAKAAVKAWKGRKPGGMSWAMDQAVVGFNRRFVYLDGSAKLLGRVNTPEFDCIEGVEDHGLLLLFFWDPDQNLTGVVINVASPAQSEQGGNTISADFWHDVREGIAARYSKDVFVLPQCAAAGEIYTGSKYRGRAESAMAKRKGITWRREIARRIVDGVDRALPVARKYIEKSPVFKHTVARIDIPVKDPPALPFSVVDSVKPAELHMLRLGDIAVATNPFELFVDYGVRIQARSEALLTFVVQLSCGHSEYLPTTRAVQGGGYSAELYLVGPEGGQVLVEETVQRINAHWR